MKCPICNSDMVIRKAKKGMYIGKSFFGCSKFPDCKGIVDIPNLKNVVEVGDIVEWKSNITNEISRFKIIRNTYESKILSKCNDEILFSEELLDKGDPDKGIISDKSLFGQILVGSKIGDVLTINNEEKESIVITNIYKLLK